MLHGDLGHSGPLNHPGPSRQSCPGRAPGQAGVPCQNPFIAADVPLRTR